MSDSKAKQIKDVYNQALKELKALKIHQAKIISKYIKILEKEKIKQLQKELQK